MPRTCPPCDQKCGQGRDCPARKRQPLAEAARLAETLFPAPTPAKLWPEERMLLIIAVATVAACLLRWI